MAMARFHLRTDLGMVVPIFVATTTLAEIFLVCFEIALLRD